MGRATATACANIALVKYWGKRDDTLNTPARGSLSLTLDALRTTTTVEPLDRSDHELLLDGEPKSGRALQRVVKHLDLIRALAGDSARLRGARVVSTNSFPTAAGLASSASGFAALTVAAARAFGLDLDGRALSRLARRGSGSAARSIFGGFVRMYAGERDEDAYASPLGAVKIELAAAIAVARAGEKAVGSTEGMNRTKATSPYHDAWLSLVDRDLAGAEDALRAGDFDRIAAISEGSCLAMHADAMAARPGVIYFKPVTLWAIERVRAMRARGVPVFFTIDAGPHVVAFAAPSSLEEVKRALGEHPDITSVITSPAGGDARVIAEGA